MVKSIVLREIWVSHQTVELIVVTEIQPCNIFTVQYVSSSILCKSGYLGFMMEIINILIFTLRFEFKLSV